MNTFISIIKPVYLLGIFCVAQLLFLVIAGFIANKLQSEAKNNTVSVVHQYSAQNNTSIKTQQVKTITIDISGAVKTPGVYTLNTEKMRLKDAVDKAGGFSSNADLLYINRHVNFAASCVDGLKYYFPSLGERQSGLFPEIAGNSAIEYGLAVKGNEISTQSQTKQKQDITSATDASTVSINTALEKELDTLPGVGEKTINAIISGRPYTSIDELRTKEIISSKLYDQLIPFISL